MSKVPQVHDIISTPLQKVKDPDSWCVPFSTALPAEDGAVNTPSTSALHQDEMTHAAPFIPRPLMVLALKSRDLVSDTPEQKREEQRGTFVISYLRAAMQGFGNVHKVAITLILSCVRDISISEYTSLGMLMCVPADYVGGLCPYVHVCDRKALKSTRSVDS